MANILIPAPPITGPWYIDREDCIGDSLAFINANTNFFASRINTLSSLVLATSAFSRGLSGLSTPTLTLNYNSLTNRISGEVPNNSINSIKLGGDILQSGRALLTSARLSALADTSFTSLAPSQALIWNGTSWTNQTVAIGGASLTEGSKNDIVVTSNPLGSNLANVWTINTGVVTETKIGAEAVTETKIGTEAVTETKIGTGAVTPTKLSTGAPSWNLFGNVGIGTTSPTVRLDVRGDAAHLTSSSTGGNTPHFFLINSSGATLNAFGPGVVFSNNVSGSNPFIITQFQNADSALQISRYTSPFTNFLTLTQTGNIGIGTTAPNQRLTVVGNISAVGNINTSGNITTTSNISAIGNISSTGNITTTSNISATGNINTTGVVQIFSTANNEIRIGQDPGSIEIIKSDGAPYIDFKSLSSEDYDCRIQQNNNGLIFATGGNNLAEERMRITNSGNVGIGIDDPNTELHIQGTVTANKYIALEDYALFSSLWG